jgi:hypothetical protein
MSTHLLDQAVFRPVLPGGTPHFHWALILNGGQLDGRRFDGHRSG